MYRNQNLFSDWVDDLIDENARYSSCMLDQGARTIFWYYMLELVADNKWTLLEDLDAGVFTFISCEPEEESSDDEFSEEELQDTF